DPYIDFVYPENLPIGTTLAALSTTDADLGTIGDTHTYSFVTGTGSDDNALFEVVGNEVRNISLLNYERTAGSTFYFRIRTTDSENEVFEKAFSLQVTNLDEAPYDLTLSPTPTTVLDNQPGGTFVGSLQTFDEDALDSHTYTLVSGEGDTGNDFFYIVGSELKANKIFYYATQNIYSIRIRTTDNDDASLFYEEVFTITVLPESNAFPSNIFLNNTTVPGDASTGDVVGDLSTQDADNTVHTYTFISGTGDTDNGSFTISGNKLYLNTDIDFFTQSSYSIRIQTDDGVGGLFEKAFTLTVTEVNVAPTAIILATDTISEDAVLNSVVGGLTTTDANTGDTHTYSLVAGTGDTNNASFAITGTDLVTAVVLDFETQSSYTVRLQTDDGNGGLFQQVFTISLNDVNEAPTDLALSGLSVAEKADIGTVVGTLATTDPDLASSHTYSLVAGAGDSGNAAFAISDNQLLTAEVFDYATQPAYSIRIKTDDGKGGTFEKVFSIAVTKVNNVPTNLALSVAEIMEKLATDTEIGTFSTIDPDATDSHTYTLVAGEGDTDNSSFSISGNKLLSGEVFDFAAKKVYSIRVQTNDGHGGTLENAFTINILEAPDTEKPVIAINSTPTEMASGAGQLEAVISVTDNSGSANVYFHYCYITRITYESPVMLTQGTDGKYTQTIQESWLADGALKYLFTAIDSAGNEAITDTVEIGLTVSKEASQNMATNLGQGGKKADWKMFSIPYDLANNSISTIFEDVLGSPDGGKAWRVLHWDDSEGKFRAYKEAADNYPALTEIKRGKGYWFNSKNTINNLLAGASTGKILESNKVFTLSLVEGWNQIGNPYLFDMDWSSVVATNGHDNSSIGNLIIFNNSQDKLVASASNKLGPYEGAYVEVKQGTGNIALKVPIQVGGRYEAVEEAVWGNEGLDKPDWQVPLVLSSDVFVNTVGGIGMHSAAMQEQDRFDMNTFPNMGGFPQLVFDSGRPEDRLTKDIINSREEHHWQAFIKSGSGLPVTIRWDNTHFGDNSQYLVMHDPVGNAIVDMRESERYTFNSGENIPLGFLYGSKEYVFKALGLHQVLLGASYPNPAQTKTIIPFSLPVENKEYEVSLTVFDMYGRETASIYQGTLPSGFHEIAWELTTPNGEKVSQGMYIYRLVVTGNSSKEKFIKRMIIK
ncbi:MAG: T9SS type A sorting domain-containing protein, partial [Cyclobacteriaceae bacterium]|nr:T9SS type A sorting domain-containing protein [Cyclobacteriaceae bacterium]